MRMSRLVAAMLLLWSAPVAAQSRTVAGTVTDAQSGEPLEGARVLVRGTALGAVTGAGGRFTIRSAPDGAIVLNIRRIGYQPASVNLAPGLGDVRATLTRDLLHLSDVVVTGQATVVDRRNLANAVATVSAEDISRVSAQSVEHALQGKVAGAQISTNSGAPGGGVQMRMRGVTSINASSEPLYIIDGVVMSNVAIPSNQNAVTRSTGGSNPNLTQDGQVNRIADINPNDIEHVEVLKGASAGAIYGSRASNGVVIITTRRGRSGGRSVNAIQRMGFSEISNTLGSRTFTSSEEAVSVFGPAAADHFRPGVVYDQEKELAGRRPLSTESVLDISGGDDNTRYFVSGLWKNDEGIIANTGFAKQGFRANVNQDFGSRLNLSVQSNLLRTVAQRGLTNNDNSSVSFWMALPFTPSFVDLRQQADGTFPVNPFVASNPLQTAELMKNDETVWRSVASARVTYTALERPTFSLRFAGSGGADYFAQKNSLLFPAELQFEPIDDGEPGTALLGNSNNLNLNGGLNAVLTYSPSNAPFTATTSVGFGAASRDLEIARIVSRNLVGGLGIVGAGTNIQVTERRQRVEDFGLFVQEELLMLDERLLLTAGISADRSSANSDTEKLYTYPKLSGSYRLIQPLRALEEVKLRAAFGQSGNQPLFGQKFTPLTATQNITGLPGLVVQGTVASLELRPEKQREIEGGADVTFGGGKGTLEVTGFRKDISDLLLQRTLAPSSGFGLEIFNGGKMRTSGFELGLSLIPIQSARTEWVFRTTYFSTRSRIIDLPVPSFRTGGFGTSLGSFEIQEGKSPTQIVGNDTLPDGTGIVRAIGDANPDFNMAFSNDIKFGSFHVYGLLDWQQGGDVINLTKFLYDLGSNTEDYANPVTVDGQATTVGARRLAIWPRQTATYVEDASFMKLREITVSYAIPQRMVSRMGRGVRSAQISVSGRNLLTLTDYTGLDPEVSNFGNQPIARNIDVAPFPPSRSFWLSLSLGF